MRTKKEVTPSDLDNIMDNSNSSYIIADFEVEENSYNRLFIYKNKSNITLKYEDYDVDEDGPHVVELATFKNENAANEFVRLLAYMTKFDSTH
jgi:hypothetical protein